MHFERELLKLSCLLGLISCCCFDFGNASNVDVTLLSTDWILTNQNQTIRKTKLKLPTGVFSVLEGENILKSYNDVNKRWIAHDNWTYSLKFSVNPAHKGCANLTFFGIDTIAEISLNHNFLGRTDNMFVRYSYDVTHTLEEENLLEVEIKSPIYAAIKRANDLGNASVPPDCPPERYHGECHINMLRKMQASFGWDWGLAVPSMGIWKYVTLEYYEVAMIRDIDVVISKTKDNWKMRISVFIDAGGHQDFYAELKLIAVELLDDPVVISDYSKKRLDHKTATITFDQYIPLEKVTTWWPNGYGDQKLYPLHFTLNAWLNDDGPSLRAESISQKFIRIGFRTIELVEERAPSGNGNTFLFKVNGEEIFMKGTNYIPSHILPELTSDQTRIRHLLTSVKEAHMNMIRIWGGGIYESDFFYQLADSYGILIWHDMMFACAMYPATNEFLGSVRKEVIQNARRIAYHPSIAIFATNNENEVALVDNWYNTAGERARFEKDYRDLYVATVMHELKIIENSARPRPIVSSPSNGKESEKTNYISENPQDPHYGDIHYYDILKDSWDPNTYPRPRFASEYGFQSLPKMQSWLNSKNEDDDLMDLIKHRQHHPAGMLPIEQLIRRHLPLPLPEDSDYVEALIYFSQITQAMATKVETELYRSLRDTEYKTMGALYWQLNDVWVAPSWSSIDFYGNYKLLHYWAREFMAPISIVALYDAYNQAINITLICDLLQVYTNDLSVTANVYLYSQLYPQLIESWPVTLKPNGVQYDKVVPLKHLIHTDFTKTNSFIEFTLQRNTTLLSRTYYFPSSLALADNVMDPGIALEISWRYCLETNKVSSYSLTITVRYPAIFVYIEVRHPKVTNYKLSRNGYMQLVPAQMVHLEFDSDSCVILSKDHIKVLTVNQFMRRRN